MAAAKGNKSEKLTEKQEAFVRAYFEHGNGGRAYREAFDVDEKTTDNWIYVEACQLLDRPKIAHRLQVLRDQAERLSIFTREKALAELEEARAQAMGVEMPSAAVSAIGAKIKLCGYDRPTQVEIKGAVKHEHELDLSKLDDGQLADLASILAVAGSGPEGD